MKRLPHFYSGRKSAEISSEKRGFTLVELLVALALIPILILSATTIYINIARMMQTVFVRTQAVTEKQLVVSTLKRLVPNGVTALLDPSLCTVPPSPSSCYGLTVTMPNLQPSQQYRLMQQTTNDPWKLQISTPLGPWTDITYANSIAVTTSLPPFQVDSMSTKVTFNFDFTTHDPNHATIPASFTVTLQGGAGA